MAIHSVTAKTYWMQIDLYMFRTAGALMVACRAGRAKGMSANGPIPDDLNRERSARGFD